ncbi:MAG: hypothetical protein II317_00205 [Clostridia bacterium]|nr:hypothetical protein [Clostridia bacterium]
MLKFYLKKKTLAILLSASLLLSAIVVPLSFQATAANTSVTEKYFDFGDVTKYSGGWINHSDTTYLGAPQGLTLNSAEDTVNIMEISGSTSATSTSKHRAFWYFYNDTENASGFGYSLEGKRLLVTTCISSEGSARRVPKLDYSAYTVKNEAITAEDKAATGVIITTDAVGGETTDTVSAISGKLRLATPVYTKTVDGYYTEGAPVLDGTCGTTFLVAKKDNATLAYDNKYSATGTVFQVVTVNLGYDTTNGITFGATTSALQQYTNSKNSDNDYSLFSVGVPKTAVGSETRFLKSINIAQKTKTDLVDLAVNGDSTALTEAEKNAVATYFQSLTGLNKAMDTEDIDNRLDDYIVDYKVYSPNEGKYRILLGLNINGYSEYCSKNPNMPEKLAIALDGDYFKGTDIENVRPTPHTISVTTDTATYGVGSYTTTALNTSINKDELIYTAAKCGNTMIADMTIAYETEGSEEEDTTIDNLKINALGAAVLKNVEVGKAQSLRFGFDFSAINSAVTAESVTLKEYGIIIKSGTPKKDELISSGQKVSVTDFDATPLTDELTLVITNSDKYSHIRVSAVAYAVVEYNGTKYTVYSDNDDDKASDGVATKSVMGVMKAEMKSHTEEAAFTTAVDAANTKCTTSFDATVLDQTSTEGTRPFIKWLFYYYFNPVQA